MPSGQTLFDKIWNRHLVANLGPGVDLLHVDRHLIHEGGGPAFRSLAKKGYTVRNPELTFATADHAVSTVPGRMDDTTERSLQWVPALRAGCAQAGIRFFDLNDAEQGIVHVIGPELGLTLPGLLLVCGDSHTCTHGALGALAWGIGSSELEHVLATQTIIQHRPKTMRITCDGALGRGVQPKDLILSIISTIGAAAGSGYAVEFAGAAIRALSMEGRMTLCNMAIELGAKFGQVAPDDTTLEYVAGRPFAPHGEVWDAAVVDWKMLASDAQATFDAEIPIDASLIAPQISWGTSPEHTVSIDGLVPDPAQAATDEARKSMQAALQYVDLQPGTRLEGLRIDRVFIGSCTNSRISDLRAAAGIVKGQRVAAHVTAWVVPGSQAVKRQAEAEGLDQVFRQAGVAWREPGCSLCVAWNGESVAPGERCVSTSNRNFVGRQGPQSRTHLASPAMAAAAAITGQITDARKL